MKKLLQLLEYNFWANDQFIIRLQEQENLPDEMVQQFSHLLSAHQIWLGRIGGKGQLSSVWDDLEIQNWEGINIELYNESCDVVKSNDLENTFSYRNSKGDFFENEIGDILYHIINHSTHHRAQVALLMRKNEMLPPQSDIIFWLRK